jgi:hypothetical protein
MKSLITEPSETSLFPSVSYLFYNKQGPIKYDGDEIYIDCKPVNNSGTEDILFDKSGENISTYDPKYSTSGSSPKNMTLLEIMGIFLFVILLFVAGTNIYRKVSNKSSTATSTATALVASPLGSPTNTSQYTATLYNIIQYLKELYDKKKTK